MSGPTAVLEVSLSLLSVGSGKNSRAGKRCHMCVYSVRVCGPDPDLRTKTPPLYWTAFNNPQSKIGVQTGFPGLFAHVTRKIVRLTHGTQQILGRSTGAKKFPAAAPNQQFKQTLISLFFPAKAALKQGEIYWQFFTASFFPNPFFVRRGPSNKFPSASLNRI